MNTFIKLSLCPLLFISCSLIKKTSTPQEISNKYTMNKAGGTISLEGKLKMVFSPDTFTEPTTIALDYKEKSQQTKETSLEFTLYSDNILHSGPELAFSSTKLVTRPFMLTLELPKNFSQPNEENGEFLGLFAHVDDGGCTSMLRPEKFTQEGNKLHFILDSSNFYQDQDKAGYRTHVLAYVGKMNRVAEQKAPVVDYQAQCKNGELKSCIQYASLDPSPTQEEQRNLYQKACDGKLLEGCVHLASLEGQMGNKEKEKEILKKACDHNHLTACDNLGNILNYEAYLKYDEAKQVLKKSCEANDIQGCINLGQMEEMRGHVPMAHRAFRKVCDLSKDCELLINLLKRQPNQEELKNVMKDLCRHGHGEYCERRPPPQF